MTHLTFREATDLLAVPLEDVAKAVGRSYRTVMAYRLGQREVPDEVLKSLAAFMRSHSTDLAKAAERLEKP